MKYLKEYILRHEFGDTIVVETPTLWLMTYKRWGYALCWAENWKYKKKDYKTIEEATSQFIDEVNDYYKNKESQNFTLVNIDNYRTDR